MSNTAFVLGLVILVVALVVGAAAVAYVDGVLRVRQSYPPCDVCGRRVRTAGISYWDGRNYHHACHGRAWPDP